MPDYHAIRPDLYTLEVVYPDIKMDPVWQHFNNTAAFVPSPDFIHKLEYSINDYGINDNCYYLKFQPGASYGYHDGITPAPTITYNLSCPSIFGDEEVHEIVTYWEPNPERPRQQKCYRIEYAGKEFNDITYNEYGILSFATLILENR
jgi:hypothetical protein